MTWYRISPPGNAPGEDITVLAVSSVVIADQYEIVNTYTTEIADGATLEIT